VKRIRQELSNGPFVRRYRPEETDDGLQGTDEGTFTLCSFWLVRVLALMGEVEEARELFEELLGYANHLGLFSEMIDPNNGTFLGNFPQAFTHVGIIVAADDLVRMEDEGRKSNHYLSAVSYQLIAIEAQRYLESLTKQASCHSEKCADSSSVLDGVGTATKNLPSHLIPILLMKAINPVES
jgi:hypothetical protein